MEEIREHRSELHKELAETELDYTRVRQRFYLRKKKLKRLNSKTAGYRKQKKLVDQDQAELDRLYRAKQEIIEELREMDGAPTSTPVEHRGGAISSR